MVRRAVVRKLLERSTPKQKDDEKQPEGGFDDTPFPALPNGFTIEITFHGATDLPAADIATLSCDAYVLAELRTDLPKRHKEDPPIQYRTRTIQRSTSPRWEESWVVANVPASGFELKCRLYDEDFPDNDDRLGNVTIPVFSLNEHWGGISNAMMKVNKNARSPVVYFFHPLLSCYRGVSPDSFLNISIKVLHRTGDVDGISPNQGSRICTLGPTWMRRHNSPMLGLLVGTKVSEHGAESGDLGKVESKYDFQANEFQLKGPVPDGMYHRYVAFRPLMKTIFTASGLNGWIVSRILHHQHRRTYNFDSKTTYVRFVKENGLHDMTLWFLNSTHYGRGGRIFTYVILLDGVMRFTETGEEFGIDGLSKHALHSDGSVYIAFSGEFFVRRIHNSAEPSSEKGPDGGDQPSRIQEIEADDGILQSTDASRPEGADVPQSKKGKLKLWKSTAKGGAARKEQITRLDDEQGHCMDQLPEGINPADYELVIDNDSGTYRPNGKLIPELQRFLSNSFPGLKIRALDGRADEEELSALKKEQKEMKEKSRQAAGRRGVFRPRHGRNSSLSSSDVESLQRFGRLTASSQGRQAKKDHKGEQQQQQQHNGAAVNSDDGQGPSEKTHSSGQ